MTRLASVLVGAVAVWSAVVGACAEDDRNVIPQRIRYPAGPYGLRTGDVVPDFSFEGVDGAGKKTTIRIGDAFDPGGAKSAVLLVEISGGEWCGTCRFYAEHEADIKGFLGGGRVKTLQVILGNRDNGRPDAADAASYQGSLGISGTPVASDSAFDWGDAVRSSGGPLPLLIAIDARNMRILDERPNPARDEWQQMVEDAVAEVDGRAPPPIASDSLVDGRFHPNEWDLISRTALPAGPPADPTNRAADSSAAATLGKELFFDTGLSPSGTVSCGTCHDPKLGLSDGKARAHGMGDGPRRTPGIALASYARWQFWDGRADTTWSQALGPLESPLEFGSSRVFVARRLLQQYATALEAAFPGDAPSGPVEWPAAGKPGDPAYDAMSEQDRTAVTRLFVDAGKAIAAYERRFRVKANAFDAYASGHSDALTSEQKYGLELFVRQGCMQCHWGPRLTDDAFHDTRIPDGGPNDLGDRGRIDGFAAWRMSEFRADGRWSDATPPGVRDDSASESMLGQFKTPPLRGVAAQPYFGHGGAFDQLSGVTELYGSGGVPAADPRSVGVRDPWLVPFGETAEWGLVPFLETLTAEPMVP